MPVVNLNFKPLQDLLLKKSEANILLAGLELKIFSNLATYHSAEEIAENLHMHTKNTNLFLNALVACDLICKYEELFWNSPIANEFLVEGKETYLGDYLLSCDPWYTISPELLCRFVREGPSASESQVEMRSGEFWEMQTRGSINYQRSGMAQIIVDLVSSIPEYEHFSKILDLGCGPGLYGIALILDHPDLQGVLFDQPPVATVAKRNAEDYGVSDRITVISGDYLNDPIGEGYDLILASMTLNFALGSFDSLMNKIFDALNPGGVFVVMSDGRTHDGTKPENMVIPMLLVELMGQDIAINEDYIANAMLDAGFYKVRSKPVQTPVGEVECTIGKKYDFL